MKFSLGAHSASPRASHRASPAADLGPAAVCALCMFVAVSSAKSIGQAQIDPSTRQLSAQALGEAPPLAIATKRFGASFTLRNRMRTVTEKPKRFGGAFALQNRMRTTVQNNPGEAAAAAASVAGGPGSRERQRVAMIRELQRRLRLLRALQVRRRQLQRQVQAARAGGGTAADETEPLEGGGPYGLPAAKRFGSTFALMNRMKTVKVPASSA